VSANFIISQIGSKLRELRKIRNIGLTGLSEKSGLSIPMISKIENGRVVPTLPSLLELLEALKIEPQIFFSELNSEQHFDQYKYIASEDYKEYIKEENAIGFLYKSILEHSLEGFSYQITHVTLQPQNQRPKVTTDAFEFMYILDGEIDYYLNDKLIKLKKGDSLFFDGRIPHVPLNQKNHIASYIVIYFFNN